LTALQGRIRLDEELGMPRARVDLYRTDPREKGGRRQLLGTLAIDEDGGYEARVSDPDLERRIAAAVERCSERGTALWHTCRQEGERMVRAARDVSLGEPEYPYAVVDELSRELNYNSPGPIIHLDLRAE
jgi:hypothetical protein